MSPGRLEHEALAVLGLAAVVLDGAHAARALEDFGSASGVTVMRRTGVALATSREPLRQIRLGATAVVTGVGAPGHQAAPDQPAPGRGA